MLRSLIPIIICVCVCGAHNILGTWDMTHTYQIVSLLNSLKIIGIESQYANLLFILCAYTVNIRRSVNKHRKLIILLYTRTRPSVD